MKKKTVLLCIILFLLPVLCISPGNASLKICTIEMLCPGEIIAVACSDPYPTLGQPVSLIITIEGNAYERFNETLMVIDEFSGFVYTNGDLQWVFGNSTESQQTITVGVLSKYTKKIPWYPSLVGNHTFHVIAGAFPEKQLIVSVGFDVEGIITPSLGCPSIIIRDKFPKLHIMLSEKRTITDDSALILKAELSDAFNTEVYNLQNQTIIYQTWVTTGSAEREDDLVASFNIDNVPDGFYDLKVTTTKDNYNWPHAVRIQQTEPTNYIILHLSDIHIGKFFDYEQKKQELIRLFTYSNENIHPDFIIITGDSVDWYNQRAPRNAYAYLRQAILFCEAPVFTTPGNHERYENRLLFLYFPFKNLTGYHLFLNPLNDYSIRYGNMTFIFLDSGYEYNRWEIKPKIWNPTPESSGLTQTQMYLLENIWGASHHNQKIIAMHHPAVNDKNDSGFGALPNDLSSGNDECIAFNRGTFITYCITHKVLLVLTGHSHENHVFTSLGKETADPSAWPLFIQTDSATMSGQNNGGRIIHITNRTVISYEYLPFR